MRFVDRIGNLDVKLREEENGDGPQAEEGDRNDDADNSSSSNNNNNTDTNVNDTPTSFERSKSIPHSLQFCNPKEEQLQNRNTKLLKKEFEEFNTNLINTFKTKKKRHNLPKKIRDALSNLHKLVKQKRIDIRKVDKGQMILVIDYTERVKAESLSINEIAEEVPNQLPNWKENREFVETLMKRLYSAKFISRNELTVVTGLLPGGVCGTLLNPDGSLKFTRIKENNELFARQSTPYVYPLFKLHKLPIERILQLQPGEVAESIPSRLVVGMSNCQLSRVQCWLETFLTPLAKLYGDFEYIKDSTDMLQHIETTKNLGNINWDDVVLFTIDVKALYPSIKFPYLFDSLKDCFKRCTKWNNHQIATLLELIFYTLQHQQLMWDKKIYTLKQGLLTGGKHSVPLANVFLTYILKELLRTNINFNNIFTQVILLWKRFIDDVGGLSKGNIHVFLEWFGILKEHFLKYELELTADTDSFTIQGENIIEKETKLATFLDMDIFKHENTIHTKEHRKETSASSYLHYTSAHPRYVFKGIMKSQILRIRRLCSRDRDYLDAVQLLKERCEASDYRVDEIATVFLNHEVLPRNLYSRVIEDNDDYHEVRLVTLSGTPYQSEIDLFAKRMNRVLSSSKIRVSIVKTTGPSIAKLLFHNNNSSVSHVDCGNCIVCNNGARNNDGVVTSKVTGKSFQISRNISCRNGGIYVYEGACVDQYSGKTTVPFGTRMVEHIRRQQTSSVYKHRRTCANCYSNPENFKVSFVEDYRGRGKYTLSEREYLWNYRIKGVINVQKTLMS